MRHALVVLTMPQSNMTLNFVHSHLLNERANKHNMHALLVCDAQQNPQHATRHHDKLEGPLKIPVKDALQSPLHQVCLR